MSMHASRTMPLLLLTSLLTACGGGAAIRTAPVPAGVQRVVQSSSGATVTFRAMADAAARTDVVLFGEQHDDDETHRAELALLTEIGNRKKGRVVLSLEMFERDVQQVLDAYLAGKLSEADFRTQSRPWPNYVADYRPMVELAKERGWRVIAANVPRRLASVVSRRGLAAVDSLPATDRAFVARELACPKDKYYENFVEVMGGGHGGAGGAPAGGAAAVRAPTDLFYEAQCVKDETMAEAIVAARVAAGAGSTVVHVTGAFHSDYGLGTVARVTRRMPALRTTVVSAVPTASPTTADATEFLPRGQYIILALRTKP